MGENKLFVKNTFDAYFDRLKDIAATVKDLNQVAKDVNDHKIKAEINRVIEELECELRGYAEKLRTGGAEIFKRVA